MAKKRAAKKEPKSNRRAIEQYAHDDKDRPNNPPVGLVTPVTDPPRRSGRNTLTTRISIRSSSGRARRSEPASTCRPSACTFTSGSTPRRSFARSGPTATAPGMASSRGNSRCSRSPTRTRPLRDALDFYKHKHGWTNRLIAGDSLLVMNSLLEKEGMAGKVQMIYIDPPYGIRYGSNFQPFVNKREVKDGKDDDLTQEPETLKAFRDTWELGIHSFLTYLRDRLTLARELLHDSGSCFIQINDENVHHAKELADELFGATNLASLIVVKKTSPLGSAGLTGAVDFLLWYARNKEAMKFRQPFQRRDLQNDRYYSFLEDPAGERRRVTADESRDKSLIPEGAKLYTSSVLLSSGLTPSCVFPVEFEGRTFHPSASRSWRTNPTGMERLRVANRLLATGSTLRYLTYHDDFEYESLFNLWSDTGGGAIVGQKLYAVQTPAKVIERCLLMTTDPGDLTMDPTCGSGTTAYVAERWGRRWVTCDTSRVALTLAKQRLMTSDFDYYRLARPGDGVGGGFVYKSAAHLTLKSIAHNPEIKEGMTREQIEAVIKRHAEQETLYDQPEIDRTKARVSGPFTVEAVPAVTVRPIDDVELPPADDLSVARVGPTSRQDEWRTELAKTGVRGKGGQKIEFARLEPLSAVRHLHAIGETNEKKPKTVVVSFGPEHAPLEQRQVEQAWDEARTLSPKPEMILFAAFHFDPEAAKDIDELTPEKTGLLFLRLQMNTDLLTEDLKKKRASNESFWLIGQPDVALRKIKSGDHTGLWQAEVVGFDYYNPVTGQIESGDTRKIALWMLDTDYDGRSLFPRQVFFPMAGDNEGWARLAKTLKAEIDEEKIEAYRGTVSLPFEPGEHRRAAVKIVDDRGIESLKLLPIPEPGG
jgi:adenine-specific DNA-methyltransferase